MDVGEISDWLAILANLGVLVGIVFVVLQMRQNKELMQVQIQQSRAETSTHLQLTIAESEYFIPYVMKNTNGEQLTREEYVRVAVMLRAYTIHSENNFYQVQRGMLPREYLVGIRSMVNMVYRDSEAARNWWTVYGRNSFRKEFVEYMDGILAELEPGKAYEAEGASFSK